MILLSKDMRDFKSNTPTETKAFIPPIPESLWDKKITFKSIINQSRITFQP